MTDIGDVACDEVVFENTPLFNHLKEVGLDGFEFGVHYSKSRTDHQDCTTAIKCHLKKMCSLVCQVVTVPWKIVSWCSNAVYFALLHDVQHLDEMILTDFMDVIIDQKVLIEEDHIFLKNFASDVIPCSISPCYPSCAYRISLSAGLLLGFLTVKQYHPQLTLWRFPEGSFQKSVLLTTTACLLLSSLQYIFWLYYRKSAICEIAKLRELVSVMRLILSVMKKCARTIQDVEMLARGFTFVSLSTPAERLELASGLPFHSTHRQCAELREYIFIWAKECFLRYRETTLMLLNSIPIQKDLDIPSHYIARFRLDEFGPLIELMYHSEDEKIKLMAASDNFSLSAIKSVIQLMEIQQSEFLKRLGLSVLAADSSSEKKYLVIQILWKISSYMKNLLSYCKNTLALLQKSHHYYKSLEAVDNGEIAESYKKSRACRSVLHDVTVAVHSLSLHLRVALMRINLMEEHLDFMEKDDAITAIELTTVHNLDKLNSFLEGVRAEIESSVLCLEESEAQIALLQGKEKASSPQEVSYSENSSLKEKAEDSPINIFEIGDPMVEDQVFESVADEPIANGKNYEDPSSWLEEKVKLQSEREASIRLFKELKSVLVEKHEEHKLREKKALGANNEDINKVNSFVGMQQLQLDVNNDNDTLKEHFKDSTLLSDTTTFQGTSNDYNHLNIPARNFYSQYDNHRNFEGGLQTCDIKPAIPSATFADDCTLQQEEISASNHTNFSYLECGQSSFASSVASLAAEKSKLMGLHVQTFTADSFEDNEDTE